MTTGKIQKRKAYMVVGALGLLLSIGYLALGARMPFGQIDQPGAAIFPMVVGVILLFSSAAALLEGWRMGPEFTMEIPLGEDRRRVVLACAFLLGFFLLMPWIGQLLASFLFFLLTIRLLSEYSWVRVSASAAGISVTLHVIFVRLLQVPLPSGELWY